MWGEEKGRKWKERIGKERTGICDSKRIRDIVFGERTWKMLGAEAIPIEHLADSYHASRHCQKFNGKEWEGVSMCYLSLSPKNRVLGLLDR